MFFAITIFWNYIFLCYQKYLIKYLRCFSFVFFQNQWHFCIFSSLTASESLLLLVASQNQIIADNITSQVHNIYALIEGGSHIVAVDFDSVSGRVFWSDGTQGKIWSAFKNGTDRKVVSIFLLTFGLIPLSWVSLLLLCYDIVPKRPGHS